MAIRLTYLNKYKSVNLCVCEATSCYSLLFGNIKLCTFACFDHRQLANTADISMQFSSKTFWAFFFFFKSLFSDVPYQSVSKTLSFA